VGSPSRPTHVETRYVIRVGLYLATFLPVGDSVAGRYQLMRTFRSRFLRLMFPVVICLLLGGILSTEIPELLCLTDITSNDFTVQPTVSAESGRALRVTMPSATPIAVRVAEREERQFRTATEESSSPEHLELFLFHSILRR
jgi:hypothetical protein